MKLKLVESINISEFFANPFSSGSSLTNWADAKNAINSIKDSIEQGGYGCKVSGTEAIYILPKTDYLVDLKIDISDGSNCKIDFTNYRGKTESKTYSLNDGKLDSSALSDIKNIIDSLILKVTGGSITESIINEGPLDWLARKIGAHKENKENKNAVSVVADQITNVIKEIKGLKGEVKSDKTNRVFEIKVIRASGTTFIVGIGFGKSTDGSKLLINQIVGCRDDDKSATNLANSNMEKYGSLDKVFKLIGSADKLGINFKLDAGAARTTNSSEEEIDSSSGNSGSVTSRLRAGLSDTSLADLLEESLHINEAWDQSAAEKALQDSSVKFEDKVNILRYAIFRQLGKHKESFNPEDKITADAAGKILEEIGGSLNPMRTPLLSYVINYLGNGDFNSKKITSKKVKVLSDDSIKPILQKYYKNIDEFIYNDDFFKGDDWDRIKTLLKLVDQVKTKKLSKVKVIDLDQLKTYIPDVELNARTNTLTNVEDFKDKLINLKDPDQIKKVLNLISGGGDIISSIDSTDDSEDSSRYKDIFEYLKVNKDKNYDAVKVKEILSKSYPAKFSKDILKTIVKEYLSTNLSLSDADERVKDLEESGAFNL